MLVIYNIVSESTYVREYTGIYIYIYIHCRTLNQVLLFTEKAFQNLLSDNNSVDFYGVIPIMHLENFL